MWIILKEESVKIKHIGGDKGNLASYVVRTDMRNVATRGLREYNLCCLFMAHCLLLVILYILLFALSLVIVLIDSR